MKQLLLLFITLFLTLPLSAQNKLREFKINGVGSGTAYSTVIKKFGKPKQRKTEKVKASLACSNQNETHLTLNYSGLVIELLGIGKGGDLTVVSIEITSSKWIITPRISVGANMQDVKAKIGQPNEQSGNESETIFYYAPKNYIGIVNFEFQKNKLVRILMKDTLC